MFHFVPFPSDEYKIVVPVLDMVDVDEGFILTVGLLGFEMLCSRHTVHYKVICSTVAATLTVVPVPEMAVSCAVIAVPLSG